MAKLKPELLLMRLSWYFIKKRFTFCGCSFILWLWFCVELPDFLSCVSSTWPRPALGSQETGSPMIRCHIFKIQQFGRVWAGHSNQRKFTSGCWRFVTFCILWGTMSLIASTVISGLTSFYGEHLWHGAFLYRQNDRQDTANFLNHIYSNSYDASRLELVLNFIWQLTVSHLVSFSWFFSHLCVNLHFQDSELKLKWWVFLSHFFKGYVLLNMALSHMEKP